MPSATDNFTREPWEPCTRARDHGLPMSSKRTAPGRNLCARAAGLSSDFGVEFFGEISHFN